MSPKPLLNLFSQFQSKIFSLNSNSIPNRKIDSNFGKLLMDEYPRMSIFQQARDHLQISSIE